MDFVRRAYRRYRKWKIPAEKKENLMSVLNISNKMAEIVVMLLSIYLISDLHDVPRSCRHIDCLNLYASLSDSAEPDFFVRAQREACRFSFANPALIEEAQKAGLLTPKINATYEAMIAYCECLLITHPDPVYCNFDVARGIFFAWSILCISIMEMSTTVRGFRSPLIRLFSFCIIFLLFGVALAYFRGALRECGSFDFRINFRVIRATCTASLIIMIFIACAEMIAWRRAYAKAVLRFQDTSHYNDDGDLTAKLGNVSMGGTSLGSALASTVTSSTAAAAPHSTRVTFADDVVVEGNGSAYGRGHSNGSGSGKRRVRKVVRRQDTYDFSAFDNSDNSEDDEGPSDTEHDDDDDDIFDYRREG
ncbi:hypothetical protein PTSG_02973 [Salpingoeca rosetta]|uniref:Uncharacterized protein n=1 Tax=Salpingoeca rosetta (strain ATCC 50818 / BSB-021) TaxID=946362 RepID=F2U3W1_SALR5|nr:uncharacterized protein PTSG_02973 [Salpingoeca rosetta]EGD82305.1 hypothetical protein PTSG_02973 [Salpingoeca rosetta]|eukprot:XP_004996488.1 hypothetical protein PTSG_02973 [Salpingoeca rosetta]